MTKNIPKHFEAKGTHIHVTTTHDFQISLIFTRFQGTGHFEKSAPNDPKMTLNIKRSKVPHIRYHILLVSTRQVYRMTPK